MSEREALWSLFCLRERAIFKFLVSVVVETRGRAVYVALSPEEGLYESSKGRTRAVMIEDDSKAGV